MADKLVIGICADHAGYERKQYVHNLLLSLGYEVINYGTNSEDRCDYPDVAHPMGRDIEEGRLPFGIAVCGSGNGINMVLNKYPHVRSALCWTPELAELAREHNDANVLALPGRFISNDEAEAIVKSFLLSAFEGGRHLPRVNKIPMREDTFSI